MAEDFEKEAKLFENSELSHIKEHSQPYMVMNTTNPHKKLPFDLIIPQTDSDLAKREIIMFLIMKKLRYDLMGEDSIMMPDDQMIYGKLSEYNTLFPSYR